MSTGVLIFAVPLDPILRGLPLEVANNPSGAQNLSDTLNSRRATGPWVCKIGLVRFRRCAWRFRTNAPESRFPP